MNTEYLQFQRKATLVVERPAVPSTAVVSPLVEGQTQSVTITAKTTKALDLSAFQFSFKTVQQDVESPNNCAIRVYNLAQSTVDTLAKFEYSRVTLQAGYEAAYGVIFQGQIKQVRIGRESATTTYVDLLAADGDMAYNNAFVKQTLAAGSAARERLQAAKNEMAKFGTLDGPLLTETGGVLPRGKVLFGMAREVMRQECQNNGLSWNINNGQINVVPLGGYLPGDALVLNSFNGLVGIPEQTENGLQLRCLLNPRIVVGGLVKIDNKSVNQLVNQKGTAPIPYNSYVGLQLLANVSNDGLYRVYVAEHAGDTRGQNWYTDLTLLALDPSTKQVIVK